MEEDAGDCQLGSCRPPVGDSILQCDVSLEYEVTVLMIREGAVRIFRSFRTARPDYDCRCTYRRRGHEGGSFFSHKFLDFKKRYLL